MSDLQQMRRVAASIRRGGDVGYFFDHLTSPNWIEVLDEEGFFRDPPKAEREGDLISFPFWPQSQYLRRMAEQAPEEVLRIIERIPETDNIRIHEDLVAAAGALPVPLAARLTARVVNWISNPYHFRLPEEAGKLVAHLAQGGEVDSALRISRVLLAVSVDPPSAATLGPLNISPSAMGRFHEWEYQRILSTYMPDLVRADGEKTMALLCDLLGEAITKSRGDADSDVSYVWLPAVEQTSQERDHGIREHLVRAIRDAAIATIEREPTSLLRVLARLEGERWQIFRRIALSLLAHFHDLAPELARDRVMDPSLQEDVNVFHEFWLLARKAFPKLSPPDREAFLERLLEKRRADEAKAEEQETPEEREDGKVMARAWFYRRLTLLKDVLPPKWRSEHEALRETIGPFEHPEFLYYMSGVSWVGPTSPVEAKDLVSMTVAELSEFLRTWTPQEGVWEATPEGLGRIVTGIVTEAPEKYAESAAAFTGLDPTYVRALLFGLTEARKAGRLFAWSEVLVLCEWVIDQPRDMPGRSPGRLERDPDWSWARKAVVTLLSEGMTGNEGEIPIDRRQDVWGLIEPLTRDPEPTPDYEEEHSENLDPLTLSINTVRGEAMHTVMRYSLWVRRSFETGGEQSRAQAGFREMPEVQAVLEEHLQIEHDPARAVRAVYGQWFPWLVLLDRDWTADNATRIFPVGEDRAALWDAAWDAYVGFGGPYDHAFALLRDEYLRAIRDIGRERVQAVLAESSDERLAEHLTVFYWRGKLQLDEGGLLRAFYSQAPARLRAHALGFVGHALHGPEKPPVPDAVRERLQSLWQWRLEETRGQERSERMVELAEFGWWFASEKFPPDWALDQLCAVLRAVGKVEVTSGVVEAMTRLPDEYLERSVDALLLLIEGGHELWDYSVWEEDARAILARALSARDTAAREKAQDLINLTSARGFHGFDPLLSQGDGAAREKE